MHLKELEFSADSSCLPVIP